MCQPLTVTGSSSESPPSSEDTDFSQAFWGSGGGRNKAPVRTSLSAASKYALHSPNTASHRPSDRTTLLPTPKRYSRFNEARAAGRPNVLPPSDDAYNCKAERDRPVVP